MDHITIMGKHDPQKRKYITAEVTGTRNLIKFGLAVFEICSQTDRQADKHAHCFYYTPLPCLGRVIAFLIENKAVVDSELRPPLRNPQ